MFMRENVNRKGFTNAGGGDQREPAASWEGPKSVLDLQAALGNMADVFAALWPLDPTPRVLHRHGCGPKRVITNQKLVFLYIYKFDSFSFLLFFLVLFRSRALYFIYGIEYRTDPGQDPVNVW
jgi:hypothetical protein